MALQARYGKPVGFGIMNANTMAEAEARTWHGFDAAYAVLSGLAHAPASNPCHRPGAKTAALEQTE